MRHARPTLTATLAAAVLLLTGCAGVGQPSQEQSCADVMAVQDKMVTMASRMTTVVDIESFQQDMRSMLPLVDELREVPIDPANTTLVEARDKWAEAAGRLFDRGGKSTDMGALKLMLTKTTSAAMDVERLCGK